MAALVDLVGAEQGTRPFRTLRKLPNGGKSQRHWFRGVLSG